MKQFVKPAALIIAAIVTSLAQPLFAAHHSPAGHPVVMENTVKEDDFSIEIIRESNREAVQVIIKNPGKKNLTASLHDPDGTVIDNFFAGKNNSEISKVYNFTGADLGVYTITVSDGKEKIKKQIKLESVIMPVKVTVE
jgi:hypothetical protein